MGKTGTVQVKERLSALRVALRTTGALSTLALTGGFAYLVLGVIRASGDAPLPGWKTGMLAWLATNPLVTVSMGIGLTCALSLAVLAATWLPTRRRFQVDRANLYVITGRQRARHGLQEISVASGPYRLEIEGKAYLIHHRDWERLTSFFRGLANESSRRPAKTAAITAPKAIRHPTQAGSPRPGMVV